MKIKIKDLFKLGRCPYCGVLTKQIISCSDCAPYLKTLLNKEDYKTKYCDKYTSPFYYRDIVKEAVLRFKFHNSYKMAKSFAMAMKLTILYDIDVIISVPKYKEDYFYNASELLAEELSKILKIPYSQSASRKILETKKQHNLTKEERLTNLKGCFKIEKIEVDNKNVLIVDDIIATGRTIDELSKECKENGAKNVYAVSIACSDYKENFGD